MWQCEDQAAALPGTAMGERPCGSTHNICCVVALHSDLTSSKPIEVSAASACRYEIIVEFGV
jgi:hypothetical protein